MHRFSLHTLPLPQTHTHIHTSKSHFSWFFFFCQRKGHDKFIDFPFFRWLHMTFNNFGALISKIQIDRKFRWSFRLNPRYFWFRSTQFSPLFSCLIRGLFTFYQNYHSRLTLKIFRLSPIWTAEEKSIEVSRTEITGSMCDFSEITLNKCFRGYQIFFRVHKHLTRVSLANWIC
jgi:hypothetical protein